MLNRLPRRARSLTGTGLKELAALPSLTALVLAGDGITDAVLKELAVLKNLTTLALFDTKVTDAGVKAFHEARPKCKVFRPDEP